MKIRILRAVVGEGADWFPGEVRDASASFARYLIQTGGAESFEGAEHRDPEPEHRDPQPRKRTRRS